MLETLILILKTIPLLKGWFDDLVAAYIQAEIASIHQENTEAIKKAFDEHDQRHIEELLGSGAGEHSGLTDSELREELPDVKSSNPRI